MARFLRHSVQAWGVTTSKLRLRLERRALPVGADGAEVAVEDGAEAADSSDGPAGCASTTPLEPCWSGPGRVGLMEVFIDYCLSRNSVVSGSMRSFGIERWVRAVISGDCDCVARVSLVSE